MLARIVRPSGLVAMVLHNRIRHMDSPTLNGGAVWTGPIPLAPASTAGHWHADCTDVVGNRLGTNPFDLARQYTYLWIVNGPNRYTGDQWTYNDYVAGSPTGFPTWSPAAPSLSAAFVRGLARTNPNRAFVDTPVFLFELKDIPQLVYDWGRQIRYAHTRFYWNRAGVDLREVPRYIASKYVEYQFGIDPFVRDLQKMLDVVGQVDKKVKQLKHLQQGFSRRHATVFSDEKYENRVTPKFVSGLYNEQNTFSYQLTQTRRDWVSTTWNAIYPESLPKTDDELRNLARTLAFGWDISFSTLWEAMPWSWLFDWFGNVGDIFAATRNHIPVNHTGSCVMTERKLRLTNFRWENRVGPLSVTFTPYHYITMKRQVAPLVVYPEFSLPFLNGGQLSILSALSVLKGRHS